MIIGSEAQSVIFSRMALHQAKEPKELFVIEGKDHIGLYDDISGSIPKLVDFMGKHLCN